MKTITKLLLVVMTFMSITCKAQMPEYVEPELLLVSQPTMQFYQVGESDYVKFHFDVKNIGTEQYKGEFVVMLEPDHEHYYAKKSVKVKAGKIKRISVELDLETVYFDSTYKVTPVYDFQGNWYPLTQYEKFGDLTLRVDAPEQNTYVVVNVNPVPEYYFIDVYYPRPPVYCFYQYVPAPAPRPIVKPHHNTPPAPTPAPKPQQPSRPRVVHRSSGSGTVQPSTPRREGNSATPSTSRPSTQRPNAANSTPSVNRSSGNNNSSRSSASPSRSNSSSSSSSSSRGRR